MLEKCKLEFTSLAELIEHYTETVNELPCLLSSARVNHCYEWEEDASKPKQAVKMPNSVNKTRMKSVHLRARV